MFYVENTNIHFKIKCKDSLSYVFWNTLCVNMFSSSLTTSIKFNTGMLLMSARTNSIRNSGKSQRIFKKSRWRFDKEQISAAKLKKLPPHRIQTKEKKHGKACGLMSMFREEGQHHPQEDRTAHCVSGRGTKLRTVHLLP